MNGDVDRLGEWHVRHVRAVNVDARLVHERPIIVQLTSVTLHDDASADVRRLSGRLENGLRSVAVVRRDRQAARIDGQMKATSDERGHADATLNLTMVDCRPLPGSKWRSDLSSRWQADVADGLRRPTLVQGCAHAQAFGYEGTTWRPRAGGRVAS